MSATLLITPNAADSVVTATDAARVRRDWLVQEAATVMKVADRLDADSAVETLRSLTAFISEVDGERELVKAPVLKLSRAIDGLAKELLSSVRTEADRIGRLCGAFEAEERRKANEARIAAANEAARIAFEAAKATAKAIAAAPNQEAAARATDAIAGAAQVEIVAVRALAVPAPKVAESTLRKEIKFEVDDIRALFAAEPNLVTLEPNGTAIRAIIKSNPNIVLPGLRHWTEDKLNLR